MTKRKKFPKGWSAGYTDYRYGTVKTPIKLAPVFTGQKRAQIVDRTTDVLRSWHLTPFENEGSARHGIRSHLCLQGHSWLRSDAEAASLVDEGLRRLNAQRPTWEQGQPEYVEPRENCIRCYAPLDPHRLQSRFCGPVCAKAYLVDRDDRDCRHQDQVRYAAFRMVDRARQPIVVCIECKTPFQPDRGATLKQFCSRGCAYRHRNSKAAAVHHRECKWCSKPFIGKTAASLFCSSACQVSMSRCRRGVMTPHRLTPPVFDHYVARAA